MFQMPNFLISRHGLSPAVQMGEKTDCSLYNISGELIDNDVGIWNWRLNYSPCKNLRMYTTATRQGFQ